MSTGGPTSFYDVPRPDADSPPQHQDGDDCRVGGGDQGDVPRDDHSGRQQQWTQDQSWEQWNGGDWGSSQWGHSWGKAERAWDGADWARRSYRGYGYEQHWGDRPTWGSASTGSGSADCGAPDRDSKDSASTGQWGGHASGGDGRYYQENNLPDGWGPSTDAQGRGFKGQRSEGTRGPSEKMIVPSFSGTTGDSGDDIGTSARSYLRQVSAWRRMTRMSEDQQGLTLYQHLTDRAWIDAERLDVDRLASRDGVDYLLAWVKDRYLDVQTVRDYMAEFDRALARLTEVGCHLPDVAAAWVFVDRMGLEEQAELNLLASVGNQYSLKALQQAAIVHDRGLRKPWENQSRHPRKDWNASKKPHSANMAGHEDYELYDVEEEHEESHEDDMPVPEEVAQELYQAFMTHASAKQKYRESAKLRGSDPDSLRQLASEKLKAAKAKSFCSGCKRRGHWHKDAVCPLNRGANQAAPPGSTGATPGTTVGGTKDSVKPSFPCHVVHVTWEISQSAGQDFLAITDTACSRSVAGAGWIDSYISEAKKKGCEPAFVACKEAFRFGASKIFVASYAVVLCFQLGLCKVALKVAVVNGEVPLLVSRSALGKMGLVMDIEANTATFKRLGVTDMILSITETGHPAFVVKPTVFPAAAEADCSWDSTEIKIFSCDEQYMVMPDQGRDQGLHFEELGFEKGSGEDLQCSTSWMVSLREDSEPHDEGGSVSSTCSQGTPSSYDSIFYPKKIGRATKNLLLDASFNPETFASWWSSTSISNDFWVENEDKSDLLTAPTVSRPKTLSEFTKAELITEARARNLWFHESWTAVEIKSLIQEDRKNPSANHPANTGMSNMTVDQLKEKAMVQGYHLPPHATKGTIMRILRDQGGMSGESILGFGRFRGNRYKDTPESYRTWAIREVTTHDNPSEDLVMFANWWQGELHRWRDSPATKTSPSTAAGYLDPEEHAMIPYVDEASSTASWDVLTREALAHPTPKSKAPSTGAGQQPKTPPRRRTAEDTPVPTPVRMDQEELAEDYDEDYDEIYFECDDEKVEFLRALAQSKPESTEDSFLEAEPEDEDDFIREYLNPHVDGEHKEHRGDEHLDMNSGGNGDVILCEPSGAYHTLPLKLQQQDELCEVVARDKFKNKEFGYEDLLQVVKSIPLTRLRRGKGTQRAGDQCFEYFLGGMYTHGSMKGLSRRSRALPWTTKYINMFLKTKYDGRWTSFVIFRNAATEVHTDSHNLRDTPVATVSFGNFKGGKLWIEETDKGKDDPNTVIRRDNKGRELYGKTVSTKEQLYIFDGKSKHATEPWEGERWTLSCYTTRGYVDSDSGLRDELRELRFPLRGLPLRDGDHGGEKKTFRPCKSVRKALWKKAGRLAALTTWCTSAATSSLLAEYPLGRGVEAVSLYEIGGYDKTLEVTNMEYLAAEPFAYEPNDLADADVETVHRTLEAFTPAVVWVHGKESLGFLEKIYGSLCSHVEQGHQLALEALPDDPCWENPYIQSLLERFEGRCHRREAEPHVLRINDVLQNYSDTRLDSEKDSGQTLVQYMAQHDAQPPPEQPSSSTASGASSISFEGDKEIASEVKISLRRLHQNMGHPNNLDLARHLRLAGADPSVVDACKKMRCQVCERARRGRSAKPASLPNLLEFNQVVAVDAFYVYASDKRKVELMMAIDVGTGFVAAGLLQGHGTSTMEASFCSIWSNTFGAPGTLVIDLESGLQAGLGKYSEWHGTHLRPIAGQAHWQNGTVERAIRTWKEIWSRVVDETSATHPEANMVITSVNAAMNTLRRESGFSPSQAVWGRDPKLPEDITGGPHDEHVEHILSHDRLRAREHTLRVAAKSSYFRCQNDARLRRSLLQRSRVAGPDLGVGAHIFFYRKPKNNKNWEWHGPAVVIGHEGPNTWVSFTGRCHLVAPEHIRIASSEELGSAFTMRSTQRDLQLLLERDFSEEATYEEGDVEMEEDPELPPGDGDLPEPPGGGRRREGPEASARVVKRHRVKGPQAQDGDPPAVNEAMMMKLPKTPRAREKALEKEIPWRLIPAEQHSAFKEAEQKQWREHVQHGALEALSVSQSRQVLATKPDRILGSRFAYKDKLWCQRKGNPSLGWKPKARLVIHGHRDPDLSKGLPTHAPTISRQGIHLLLQILASNLRKGWRGFAGDVTAAFLCGEELRRELYLRQPATGLGDLHPEQLLRIRKPFFGLVDSPSAWWTKFYETVGDMKITDGKKNWKIVQSSLDHCIFMVQEVLVDDETGKETLAPPQAAQAYLGVHVDDVLLVGDGQLCEVVKERLSQEFPIQDWETGSFEYVGSYIEILSDMVRVTQGSYAATRLFEVEVERDLPDHYPANDVQVHDNMSLVGALSWMASQTRPDLQVGVSMSQQRQKEPCLGDIRFTNQLAKRAMEHKDEGLTFYPIDLDAAVLLCYHDAGWANVPQSQEDPYYKLTEEEDLHGTIRDGPFARKDAKAKKTNSSITSQLGGLYVLANASVLTGTPSRASVLDWRSGACERVCRSTFSAETMACCTASETGIFISKFLETLLTGKLARTSTRFEMRFVSDCRSLYDHLTRAGVPRVPTCKRLAIDLAGIREDLKDSGRIVWVPTWAQLSDILTKPLRAEGWWRTLKSELKLTFKEGGGEIV
ncbi:GIP [Symbiodinium sp. CCMP2592]|nr:GIP [Symbiodinium sp. CCMP2592]CAE7364437.1 GIP [Symbiodinium sp. CCMP2592]